MEAAEGLTDVRKPRRRRLWPWLAFAVLLIVGVRGLLPETLGEQARRTLEAKLQAHYPELLIRIGEGRYTHGQGFVLRDLDVRLPAAGGRPLPLVHVDRLVAFTQIDWRRLRLQEVPLTAERVIVSGLEVNLWSDAEGTWPLEKLLPFPQLGPGCPWVEIRGARVRMMQDPQRPAWSLEWSDIDATVRKVLDAKGRSQQVVQLQATSSHCEQLVLRAQSEAAGWGLEGEASGLLLEHDRLTRLPGQLARAVTALEGLSLSGSAKFSAQIPKDASPTWRGTIEIDDGRWQHPRFGIPATAIRGTLHADPSGLQFDDIQFGVDESWCRVSGQRVGHQPQAPLRLQFQTTDFHLGPRLAETLPPALREKWDRLQPEGRIDASGSLDYVAGRWKWAGTVQAKGVNVRFDRFPYPVRQLNGKVDFRDGFIWSRELYGTVDNQPMRCELRLSPPGSGQPQSFRARVKGVIAIDETLFSALTPRHELRTDLEEFARSLHPAGGVRVDEVEIKIDAEGRKQQRIDLQFVDAQLRYEGFPYPLYNVTGRVLVRDTKTQLIDFIAENGDRASLRCNGVYEKRGSSGQLQLRFEGRQIPLDGNLRAALGPDTQQTWDALVPTGILEQLDVHIERAANAPRPTLRVLAKLGGKNEVSQESVSLRPVAMPYRMDLTSGVVNFEDGVVTIENLQAWHGSSQVAAHGRCAQDGKGRWVLDLNLLSGSRITFDNELTNCLPPKARGICQRTQLRGPVGLRGRTSFVLPGAGAPEPEVRFDVAVQLEGNRIGDSGPVREIRGELNITGEHAGGATRADGRLQIDSMHYRTIQLTGIHGPFAIRDDQLSVGARNVTLNRDNDFMPVAGHVFGGQFTMAGRCTLPTGQYDVFCSLDRASVNELLADFQQSPSEMTGQVLGEVRLEGTLGAPHLLRGAGQATLSDANLYQLPVLVQLMSQLRVTPDEEAAFTDGKATFTLSGDEIKLSELQLWGELIALHGAGTVNRLKDLDLTLNTRVSPQNAWNRLIQPLTNQDYTLWTIDVRGPIGSPAIDRRAFDGVSETLERLFPGVARGTGVAPNYQ